MMPSRPAPWLVLIVEPRSGPDCVQDPHLRHLEDRKCSWHKVHSADDAVVSIRHEVPRLILLNPAAGEGDPIEVFEYVHRAAPSVPVIVLLHAEQIAAGGTMVASGAADYFVHGTFDPWKLEKRIRREIHAHDLECKLGEEAILLRALLDSIPDRIYFKDRESRFIRVSRALANFFEVADPTDMIGDSDADYFDATHATASRNDELNIIHSGMPVINRLEKETFPDGRSGWALTTKVPFKNNTGRIIGTLGISRDVTELHTMQLALAEERNLLSTLIHALPDSIYIKDCQSRFLLANRFCTHLMGAGEPEKLVGKCDHDFFPKIYADRFRADEQRLVQTGEALLDREEEVRFSDGSIHWMLTSKVPIRDAEGRVAGFVGIGRDMTRFRRLEEEVEMLHNQMDPNIPAAQT